MEQVRGYVWHDDVFPWPVHAAHSQTWPTKYIQALSVAAKTGGGAMDYLKVAYR
ncbi:hypothetical protein [Nonomuraea turkmeniaca]|uniref:hypothetical protein n=1 Tax=Nonomuraea turkmeniaca TaxID=103838 RepID=UPI001477752E|nr:hypothetical protein [Nonomuraea turkmeniaca]